MSAKICIFVKDSHLLHSLQLLSQRAELISASIESEKDFVSTLKASRFDVLIVDEKACKTKSYAQFRQMQARGFTRVPVLLVVEGGRASAREQVFKMGASGFIREPISERRLLESISALVDAVPVGLKRAA